MIAYGYNGTNIFDRVSLSLIHQATSSIHDSYSGITSSKINNRIYFGWIENREFVGFGIYGLDSMKVIEAIRSFNSSNYPGITDVDFVITQMRNFYFYPLGIRAV